MLCPWQYVRRDCFQASSGKVTWCPGFYNLGLLSFLVRKTHKDKLFVTDLPYVRLDWTPSPWWGWAVMTSGSQSFVAPGPRLSTPLRFQWDMKAQRNCWEPWCCSLSQAGLSDRSGDGRSGDRVSLKMLNKKEFYGNITESFRKNKNAKRRNFVFLIVLHSSEVYEFNETPLSPLAVSWHHHGW